MNRRTDSRRDSVHICVDQLAGLVARAGHQVPVAGEGLLFVQFLRVGLPELHFSDERPRSRQFAKDCAICT